MFEVEEILGRTPAAVDAKLGEPYVGTHEPYPTRWYMNRQVEVNFVNGRAEWVTFVPGERLEYGPEALGAIGIETNDRPTFRNEYVMRWENLALLRRIQIFSNGSGGVHYIFVNADLLPEEL